MFVHRCKIRVRYAHTDQMGFVYYGRYANFYEIGRVELLRSLGFNYKQLEDEGIMMPVLVNHSEYKRPAHYDDLLSVQTSIRKMPTLRFRFDYQIHNEGGVLLNEGYTELVFVKKESRKPCRVPQKIIDLLKPHFNTAQ